MICTVLCSAFLGNIKDAFDKDSDLSNLLLDSFFKKAIDDAQVRGYSLRNVFFLEIVPPPTPS